MLKCLNENKGTTLVELLVVVAIIAILSGVAAVNYKSGNSQLALSRAANKLAQDIRRAQEMAMSAAECEECGGFPARYGILIKLDANYYELAAEMISDLTPGVFDQPIGKEISDFRIGDEIYFESSIITVSNIDTTNCTNYETPLRAHITFAPPDPVTKMMVGVPTKTMGTCSEIVLTLRVGADGPTKLIRINSAGLISVE